MVTGKKLRGIFDLPNKHRYYRFFLTMFKSNKSRSISDHSIDSILTFNTFNKHNKHTFQEPPCSSARSHTQKTLSPYNKVIEF